MVVVLALVPAPATIFLLGMAGGPRAVLMCIGLPLTGWMIYGGVRWVRSAGRRGLYLALGTLALVVLPVLGLCIDGLVDTCDQSCSDSYRPLAMPEVFGLLPLQALAAVSFFLSVRRPQDRGPRFEAGIASGLLAGIVLHLALATQFFPKVGLAFALIPLPILTPYLTVPLLLHQLVHRLRARGHEALVREVELAHQTDTAYRGSASIESVGDRPVSRPLLLRGFAGSLLVLGVHAILQDILFQSQTGVVDVFLKTCDYPFSQLQKVVPQDCHYLCTIAARGSPRLVKPLRWGTRRGHPIIVNRQLAVANAFEDLLHERWPRFGRVARRTYDALAFPISGALARRGVSDALYLLMKPAEVLFALCLLFFDPGDPEARVDRMYR
jgi:hypothetical protein